MGTHDSTLESFLSDFNGRTWSQPGAPDYLTPRAFYQPLDGVRLDVVYATAPHRPKSSDVRALWEKRWNRRPTGALLVVGYPGSDTTARAAVVGLRDDAQLVTDLSLSLVERIVEQSLDAPTTAQAEQFLDPIFLAREDDEVLGLHNTGLFATHELLANVPNRSDWNTAGKVARSFRGHSGEDLVRTLGWEVSHEGADLILRKDGREEAIAVLLQGSELFDRPSARFGETSPVQHGISVAHNSRVKWVLAVQGSRIRLYTADPDTGIARKGSDTYTEIDFATMDDEHLAYAALLMTPAALCQGGTAQSILAGSMDHAAALGERLRDRIYVDVVPGLATAVAERRESASEAELRSAYHTSLVILFRLLFVAYAEDRGLLPYRTNEAYTHISLKERARYYAKNVHDGDDLTFDAHAHDLWDNLLNIWHGVFAGHTEWGIPPYGGSLFDPDGEPGSTIAGLRLTNAEVGPALVKLLVDTGRDSTQGPVDFQTLSVREFGTIYEGLLESSLSIAPCDLVLDGNGAYLPANEKDQIVVTAGQVYFHNASGMRKSTGSFFTKQFAVEHLLETSLDPTVEEHLARVDALVDAGELVAAYESFWDFRVADISMGSGHFLVGAVDHIASAFSAFLARRPVPGVIGELDRLRTTAFMKLTESGVTSLPEIDQMTLVRRQVAKRCIYGIDINEIAVDLARLALWIHTFVPGLPMSSLDHGLVRGNSLAGIGTLEEAFDVFEPNRNGVRSLLADRLEEVLKDAATNLQRVGLTAEATAQETREAEAAYAEAIRLSEPAKAILDAAVAVRLGLVNLNGVLDTDQILNVGRRPDVKAKIEELSCLHFIHSFPEVFIPRHGHAGGFHVILGNPPWEKVRHEPHQFWVIRDPGLRALKGKKRDERIAWLRQNRPLDAVEEQIEAGERERLKDLLSGAYKLQKSQHYDFAKVFAERSMGLIRAGGAVGVVMPQALLVLGGWAPIRERMVKDFHLSTFPLRNRNEWLFDGVEGRMTICLVSLRVGAGVTVHAAADSFEGFRAEQGRTGLYMGVHDLEDLSDELNVPWFEHSDDPAVFKKMSVRPHLGSGSGWVAGTADSTRWDFSGSGKHKMHATESDSPGSWRVTMTRHVDAYSLTNDPEGRRVPNPAALITGLNGIKNDNGRIVLDESHPPIVFRFPTNNDNSRTLVATALPEEGWLYSKGYAHGVRLLRPATDTDVLALLGYLNSVPADWWARRFVDRHLGKRIIDGLPLPAWTEEQRDAVAELAATLLRRNGYSSLAGGRRLPVGSGTTRPSLEILADIDAMAIRGLGLSPADAEVMLCDFAQTDDAVSSDHRLAIRRSLGKQC